MSARKKYARYSVSISVQPWNQKTHWVVDGARNNARVTIISSKLKTAEHWRDVLNAGIALHPRYYSKDYFHKYLACPVDISIRISGNDTADRKAALKRAMKQINAGEISGQDCKGTNWFIFSVDKGQL